VSHVVVSPSAVRPRTLMSIQVPFRVKADQEAISSS
jgi:hypothetical protein